MRVAFSSMARNTGANSPGDALITRNTSAVAVCCSSDRRNSFSSRVFSMAITAWLAKFLTSNLLVGEGANFLTVDNNGANQCIIFEHWHPHDGSGTGELCRIAWVRFGGVIYGMDDLFCPHHPLKSTAHNALCRFKWSESR